MKTIKLKDILTIDEEVIFKKYSGTNSLSSKKYFFYKKYFEYLLKNIKVYDKKIFNKLNKKISKYKEFEIEVYI